MSPRREYAGAAPASTLNGAITALSATITIVDGAGWPTGASFPFVVIIDRGLAAEEKALITSRTGNVLTVNTRGFDSTTAASHANGATIEHGLSAADINEVNDHTFDTTNDDHTQYLNNARHDVEARHTFGAALGTAQTPVDITGAAAAAGSGANPSREDHIHMLSPPACRVFHNANQSIADATETTVAFNSERFDTDTMHDTVTNNSRITFNTAGVYVVTFNGRFLTAADYSAVYVILRKNGTTNIAQHMISPSAFNLQPVLMVSTTYKFAATDFVEARVFHDNTSNAARTLDVFGEASPEFSAVFVSDGI